MKVILLSSDGSWFHNLSAAAAKALSPRVDRVLTTGGDKSSSSFDLRLQFDFDLIDIRSEMYLGANPWIALKVIKITLINTRRKTYAKQNVLSFSQSTRACIKRNSQTQSGQLMRPIWRVDTMVLPVHIGIFDHAVNGIADCNRRKDIQLLDTKLTVSRGV